MPEKAELDPHGALPRLRKRTATRKNATFSPCIGAHFGYVDGTFAGRRISKHEELWHDDDYGHVDFLRGFPTAVVAPPS